MSEFTKFCAGIAFGFSITESMASKYLSGLIMLALGIVILFLAELEEGNED